jgi:hypothetical protein
VDIVDFNWGGSMDYIAKISALLTLAYTVLVLTGCTINKEKYTSGYKNPKHKGCKQG